uniref:SUN domain-containing protein 2-like n=1 Tax=Lepisosteus oculatus TaxID=7918 RepID=W5N094_LEPOC|nr:PREDICTED: SUN domain-containing protein 2-like [Lepisosteus oculatus]
MNRRSRRLVDGGYYQPEDDGASTSSTGSVNGGQISYRESPVRIFKKKVAGRRQVSSSCCLAHENASSESLGSYASEEPIRAEEYWGIAPSLRALSSSSRASSRSKFSSPGPDSQPGFSSRFSAADGHGNSSGYSSSEEGCCGPAQPHPDTEPQLGVKDLLLSPGRALAMLYWWLGTAWYSLTTGASLLDVFLLTRSVAGRRCRGSGREGRRPPETRLRAPLVTDMKMTGGGHFQQVLHRTAGSEVKQT